MGHRIVFLDALRFVAAAAVVFQHVVEREGPRGQALVAALSPGVFGVVLFFIISGFVIPMAAKKRLNLGQFALRRVFRIYPLVLTTFGVLAVVGYSGLLPSLSYLKAATARDWIANLLLVQDYAGALTLWGVTWTLNLEVAWYTLFALSLLVIGPRFDDRLAIVAPVLLLSLALLSLAAGHRLPLARMGMVYAAILGARFYRGQSGTVSRDRVLIDLLIFMVVMTICNVISFGYFRHPNITMGQAVYPWLAAPVLFGIVALVPQMRDSRLVNSRVIGWLGSISFSTYLLHGLAMHVAEDYVASGGVLVGTLVLTLVFSVLGYYLVEVPGQKLGRWVESWRRPAPGSPDGLMRRNERG
ncbi:acyltransferase family protein [Methylobacterium sp. P31]